MGRGDLADRYGWGQSPGEMARALTPRLTADHMAEAVVRAAMATGELSLLAYRDEQALKGHVAFRARWVALAALAALHPTAPIASIAGPLGCGPSPLAALAHTRGQGWWDEALVSRLFVDLAGAADRRDLAPLAGLHRIVSGVLAGLMTTRNGEGRP
jgi:hypothetical protein